jgi:DNA excision repair protein ERCC-4
MNVPSRTAKVSVRPPQAIICDTREQAPLQIPDMIRAALPAGDYTIEGYEDRVVLERKSLPDLLGVIGGGRERFERELERLVKYERGAVLIEASMTDVLRGTAYSRVSPRAVMGSLLTWWVRYGVPPIFCDNRRNAAATVRKILSKFAAQQENARTVRAA